MIVSRKSESARAEPRMPVIVVHGGAGVAARGALSDDLCEAARSGLAQALRIGHLMLRKGAAAIDVVEAAVCSLEDNPAFNAGIGAALTSAGTVEHDAAIMDGGTGMAGAVTGISRIRHPVCLARAVLRHSPHVLLQGAGAEHFALENGFEWVEPEIFITPRRLEALRRVRDVKLGPITEEDRHGTVGAVALDCHGHVAAATSTGGTTNKAPGRVGDSPLIGAGTFACDATCAISATGRGEAFIRLVFAHRISCLMELGAMPLDKAIALAMKQLAQAGGGGGVIGVTATGDVSLQFSGAGMYRGFWHECDSGPTVAIY